MTTARISDTSQEDDKQTAVDEEVAIPLTSPRHFVHHNVVAIEDLPDGTVMARTEEGDACVGYPADVLARLQEVNNWRD
jgi:hypothetical protein